MCSFSVPLEKYLRSGTLKIKKVIWFMSLVSVVCKWPGADVVSQASTDASQHGKEMKIETKQYKKIAEARSSNSEIESHRKRI